MLSQSFICLQSICLQVSVSMVAEELDDKLRRFSARAESGSSTLRAHCTWLHRPMKHFEVSTLVSLVSLVSTLVNSFRWLGLQSSQVFGLRDCRTSLKLALGEAQGSCNKTDCADLNSVSNHFNTFQCSLKTSMLFFPRLLTLHGRGASDVAQTTSKSTCNWS